VPELAIGFFWGDPFAMTVNDPTVLSISMAQVVKFQNVSRTEPAVDVGEDILPMSCLDPAHRVQSRMGASHSVQASVPQSEYCHERTTVRNRGILLRAHLSDAMQLPCSHQSLCSLGIDL
jgi:hypothetical protein